MCYTCYTEYGLPKIDNSYVRNAASLIKKLMCASLHLHIILDDWNIEDEHLDYCNDLIEKDNGETCESHLTEERTCINALRYLSIYERVSALAIAEGYFCQ